MFKVKYSLSQIFVPFLIAIFAVAFGYFNYSMIQEFGFSSPRLVFGFAVSLILLVIAFPLAVYRLLFQINVTDERMVVQEWFSKRTYLLSEVEEVVMQEKSSGVQFTPESFIFRGGRECLVIKTSDKPIKLVIGRNGYDKMLNMLRRKHA